MSYLSSPRRLRGLKLGLLIMGFALSALFLIHSKVYAAAPTPQNTLPSAGDFTQGSQVELITAVYGNGYVLDSPQSTVRLYSKSGDVQLNIVNGGDCPGQGGDVGPNNSQITTTYRVYALNPDTGNKDYVNTPFKTRTPQLRVNGQPQITNQDIGCSTNYTLNFSIPPSIPAVDVGPAEGKYAFEIEATMSTALPGWNQFKYQVAPGSGRLSFYAGSGDHFAVKAATGATPDPGNYKFGFAPGCYLKNNAPDTVPLKWFDEDAGQSNQGGINPIKTVIREYDNSGNLIIDSYKDVTIQSTSGANVKNGGFDAQGQRILLIGTGNDEPGWANIRILGHHKYEWEQYQIYDANGIQFQMPFDSYNTLIDYDNDCSAGPPPSTVNATCSIVSTNPGVANLTPNQQVTITVRATNTGTQDWNTSDTPTYRMNKYSGTPLTNQGSLNIYKNVTGPGGTIDFTFKATSASTTNTTKRITFQMGQGLYQFGSQCHVDLTTGSAPPTAWIESSCSSSVIHLTSVVNATRLVGTTQTRITKVPAAVQVHDLTDNRNWTYIWPGGIANGGDSSTQSTYGLGSGPGQVMWPHHDYEFTLFIQGNTAPTASPNASQPQVYPDNGNWNPSNDPNQSGYYYGIGPALGTYSMTYEDNHCLTAACGGTTPADVEPGQTSRLSAAINFTNSTREQYNTDSTGGYYLHMDVNQGIFGGPGDPAPTTGPILAGPGGSSVSAYFDGRVDYTGNYRVTLMFQGNPINLGEQIPCPPQEVSPATKPYFQVWGGDINTGGGFESVDTNGAFSCGNDYPDYVSPSSPSTGGDQNYGGIKAFGYTDATGSYGSLSDFGALSLGLIATNPSAKIGFAAQPRFSNTSSPNGELDSTPQDFCAMDFFDRTQKTPAPTAIGPPSQLSSLSGSPTDQYIVNQNIDSFAGGTVPSGRKITLYVKGDITITGNITYANWDPNNPDSAPSLAIVVKGNINIASNVTRIDGLFVAQPSSSGQDGEFNTCANNGGNQFCSSQLVANGAVIARKIKPLRSDGTVSQDACPAFLAYPCANFHKPAEIFNYIPSMVFISPNFSPIYNSLQGLYNLPPVF